MRIALAGNPNSGKTSMYNMLTGRSEKVGNWAGVTVDKKENPIKKSYYDGEELIAVDLPGAYSMSPFTSEESITSGYVKNENPDVIINIVDSTNLSRSLFFTTQLLELGIPVVVALNKSDINAKKETVIDTAKLSQKLGCPIIQTVSTGARKNGLAEVVRMAVSLHGKGQKAPYSQEEIDLHSKEAVQAADRARFEFVNKSPYIPIEKQDTIFEQYVSYATSHKEKGVGLGLYASKKIIDAHCHIYPEKIASKAVGGTDKTVSIYSSTNILKLQSLSI